MNTNNPFRTHLASLPTPQNPPPHTSLSNIPGSNTGEDGAWHQESKEVYHGGERPAVLLSLISRPAKLVQVATAHCHGWSPSQDRETKFICHTDFCVSGKAVAMPMRRYMTWHIYRQPQEKKSALSLRSRPAYPSFPPPFPGHRMFYSPCLLMAE